MLRIWVGFSGNRPSRSHLQPRRVDVAWYLVFYFPRALTAVLLLVGRNAAWEVLDRTAGGWVVLGWR